MNDHPSQPPLGAKPSATPEPSATPRTDAVEHHGMVTSGFARTLERELAANAAELVRVRAERDAAVANMDYQRLWQSLKDECCSNPKTACRIVLINRDDYVKAWLRAAVPGTG